MNIRMERTIYLGYYEQLGLIIRADSSPSYAVRFSALSFLNSHLFSMHYTVSIHVEGERKA